MRRVEMGHAAHFCGANECRFRRATLVNGRYIVSTVGDYRSNLPGIEDKPQLIGAMRLYETMVWKVAAMRDPNCGCALASIVEGELDFAGYNTARDAQREHEKLVRKWGRKNGKARK